MPAYTLDLTRAHKEIYSGHLRLGGTNRLGETVGLTNYYVTWNGQPHFIISGEFHYSRCPMADWEEELLKIKAGGVNIVATYVFWIFHEERQGAFEWEGQKNLRRFVQLCARHGLKVILRIGPFAHGEWHNGGLPDWLYGQPFEVRSNDAGYLACVERLYAEIERQVRGLLFADGGPVIGIQLENEYMHTGAPWEVLDAAHESEWVPAGRDGVEHLQALKALAHQVGLDAPLYLITAWGAPILEDESLPVYGGYAYPVWVDEPGPSSLYQFEDLHAQPVAQPTHRVPCVYPLANAEMQGGIQIRYRNRPVVPPKSTEALALVRIGGGSNWIGYYVYHGGTTPVGGHGFSHERLHPQLSYDFQAPIGEYGGLRPSYHGLKLLHLFLQAYGASLCEMGTILPPNTASVTPDDTHTLRYCARARDGSGFVFVNNFQDHVAMQDLDDVALDIATPEGRVRIPETGGLTVRRDECFILPVHQTLGDARLIYATAQPLTILRQPGHMHYFYFVPEGLSAELCFQAATLKRIGGEAEQHTVQDRVYVTPRVGHEQPLEIETAAGQTISLTILTRQEAEQLWQGSAWGAERVILSAADVTFVDGGLEARSTGNPDMTLTVWPPVEQALVSAQGQLEQSAAHDRTLLKLSVPPRPISLHCEPASPRKYLVQLQHDALSGVSDVFLTVDYVGDTGMAFLDGQMVADNFYNGTPWVMGLKRFAPKILDQGLCLVLHPLRRGTLKNVSSELAGRIEFEGEEQLTMHSISAVPEYRAQIGIKG